VYISKAVSEDPGLRHALSPSRAEGAAVRAAAGAGGPCGCVCGLWTEDRRGKCQWPDLSSVWEKQGSGLFLVRLNQGMHAA